MSAGSTAAPAGAANGSGGVAGSTGGTLGPGGSQGSSTGTTKTLSTSISVGFFVYKDAGPATHSLGINLTTGDGASQARAAAALVNANGGIGGRTLKPVIFDIDATGDVIAQTQRACSMFFEDNKVKAVVSALLIDNMQACSAKHGAPVIVGGISTTNVDVLARQPGVSLPTGMSLTRAVHAMLPGLQRQGYFKPRSATEPVKIGLLYTDIKSYQGVPALVRAELKRLGLSLTDYAGIPYQYGVSDAQAANSAASAAALRFNSAGVKHVLAVDISGQAAFAFAMAANSQAYKPRYGLSSLSGPQILAGLLPSGQLDGALAVGWEPAYDTPLARGPALSSTAKACRAAMTKEGEDMNNQGVASLAYAECDATVFMAAAWSTRPADLAHFVEGRRALGTKYVAAMTFRTDFSRRPDGAAAVRNLSYAQDCTCFNYVGGLVNAD